MKKTLKKSLAIILVIATLCSFTSLFATATGAEYPESEHNYQNDFTGEWVYTHPEEVEGLYITFSKDTAFEYGDLYFADEEIPEEIADDIIWSPDGDFGWKEGDRLRISTDYYYDSFEGDELSGETIYIKGSSFTLHLTTDGSITEYGFKIDRIADTPPEGTTVITYVLCDHCKTSCDVPCYPGALSLRDLMVEDYDDYDFFDKMTNYIDGSYCYHTSKDCPNYDKVFTMWIDEDGKAYTYGDIITPDNKTLTAQYTTVLLKRDEVFGFYHDDYSFDVSDEKEYYMSDEHMRTMLSNMSKAYPALISIPFSIVYLTYPQWRWKGSCYGMASTVYLQHHGLIDMLEGTEATCVRELEPTPDTISTINYYQFVSATLALCDNYGRNPGSKGYTEQLQKLYETVENGNVVLFSYAYEGSNALTDTGHTVLLIGAYTEPDGTKVLISYDCNYEDTSSHRFYIDPEFKSISGVDGFQWTAEYEQFKAFDINNEADTNAMLSVFFPQIIDTIKTMFKSIF